MLFLGQMTFKAPPIDPYTKSIGLDFTYEGEMDKVSRMAYGKGKIAHVARPDLIYEGTFVNNHRTGLGR